MYGLSLIATLPARLVLPATGAPAVQRDVDGTIWRGEASVDGLHAAAWRWAPLRSLLRFAFAADLSVAGPGTNLDAFASWRPARLVLEDLNGSASGLLLASLAPRLPFVCEMNIEVAIDRLVIGGKHQGAVGELRSDVGACRPSANGAQAATTVPALIAVSTMNDAGSSAWLAPQGRHGERLAEATLTPGGRLELTVFPAAAEILPGAAAAGRLSVDVQL